jgi:hypothetical protein
VDIVWSVLTLPYAPVRGLTALVKVIAQEAESQRSSPATLRRELEELDRAAEEGEITPQERDEGQRQVLARFTTPQTDTDEYQTQQRTDPIRRRRTNGSDRPRRGRGR